MMWHRVQMPEDIRKNDQRPPVVQFAPSSVSPSHPCRQPGKYVQSFPANSFLGLPIPDQNHPAKTHQIKAAFFVKLRCFSS